AQTTAEASTQESTTAQTTAEASTQESTTAQTTESKSSASVSSSKGRSSGISLTAQETVASGEDAAGISWVLDSNGTLTLSGTGAMTTYTSATYTSSPWYEYKDQIQSLIIGYGITKLGNYSFYGFTALTSVAVETETDSSGYEITTLQAFGSTTSNQYTFYGCTGITTLKLPANIQYLNYTFTNCTGVTDLTLVRTDSSTYPGYVSNAYGKNTAFSTTTVKYTPWYLSRNNTINITLCRGVTEVVNYAFYSCSNIGTYTAPCDVKYPNSTGSFGSAVIESVYLTAGTVYNTVSYAGSAISQTAAQCTPWYQAKAKSVTLADVITEICEYMFYNATALTSVDLGEVTTINANAFSGCSALETVTLGSNVQFIGANAFSNTAYIKNDDNYEDGVLYNETYVIAVNSAILAEYEIKDGTTLVAYGAFQNVSTCTLTLPSSLLYINDFAFDGCTLLQSFDLTGLVSLGTYAFRYCTALESANFTGASITAIPTYAFYGCTSLETVTLPSAVTTVNSYAFYSCTALSEINLSNVADIYTYAFSLCTALQDIDFSSATSVGASAFRNSGVTSAVFKQDCSIAANAFASCESLESVDLTNCSSLTGDAFLSCTALTDITVAADAQYSGSPFDGCTAITTITIAPGTSGIIKNGSESNNQFTTTTCNYTPWHMTSNNEISVTIQDGVTEIGVYAFYQSTAKNITVPDSTTVINSYAFYGAENLTGISLPETLVQIAAYAFTNCGYYNTESNWDSYGALYICNYLIECTTDSSTVVINSAAIGVADNAFENSANITDLTLPVTVCQPAGTAPFAGLSALESVTLTAGKTTALADFSIATTANSPWYNSVSTFQTLVIEDEVTQIGAYAFYNSTALENITIGNGIARIGRYAFAGTAFYNDSTNWENGVLYYDTYVIAANESDMPSEYEIKAGTTLLAAYAFYNFSSISLAVPDTVVYINEYALSGCNVTSIALAAGTTEIAAYAFYNCTGLTSIDIPDTVQSIGEYAFYGCTGLTSIEIPSGVTEIKEYTFYGCTSLESADIPDTVEAIGEYAFYGCTALAGIELPSAITEIKEYTFYNCASLTEIDLPDSLESIGEYAFAGSGLSAVSLPSGVTDIAAGVFSRCKSLTSIDIGSGVTSIGNDAFASSALTSVTIPANVESLGTGVFRNCSALESVTFEETAQITEIPANTFNNCTSLTNVTIPSSVETIGSSAFKYCTALESADLASVSEIGSNAFQGCTSLTEITIPATCESVGSWAFADCVDLASVEISEGVQKIGSAAFYNCKSIESITIPSSVSVLGDQAFYKCTSLETVDFATDNGAISLTEISNWAFAGCTALSEFTIPDGITAIGAYAFYGDTALTSLDVTDSVTLINSYAWGNCTGLQSINIGEQVSTINDYAFSGCTELAEITVDAANTSFTAEDNILYTYDLSEIVLYPNGKTDIYFEVPDTVTEIAAGAFESDTLESIVLGETVETIESGAFANCTALTDVVVFNFDAAIGSSETTLGSSGAVTLYAESYSSGYTYAKGYDSVTFSALENYEYTTDSHLWLKSAVEDVNTCTTAFTTTYTCAVCGETTTEETAAAGHSYDSGEITTAPTCTEAGVKTYTCTVCGATKEETVAATGHSYNSVVTAPTCTAGGYTT
ncbi:MAG: leucine-rich repeat domain-containing protein, partial [Clostridiales bacterium]|nr:leucine-rich repeat domain-containing protein [Clostridiales bacterium]